MAEERRHPVWDVYNELRTARLNVLYYSARAGRYRLINAGLEFASGLSGATTIGTVIAQVPSWAFFPGMVTVIVPIARKLIDLPDRIGKLEECAKGYDVLQYDLALIRQNIERERSFSSALRERYGILQQRRRELVEKEIDRQSDVALARSCQDRVNEEFPPESFYVPETI